MPKSSEWKELSAELKTFAKWIISGLIDSLFLILWVLSQWTTNRIIANLGLAVVDQWIRSTFQILFAISTLAPVAIYIYVDVRIMLVRAQRKILHEMELNKGKGSKNV